MDDSVEILRSNKGGMKLIHKGYMYTIHKRRQSGGIRWRCTQRTLHCKGSISTGYGPAKINMPHNHIPDPHSVALARCRQVEEVTDVTSFLETEYEEERDDLPLSQRYNSMQPGPTTSTPLPKPKAAATMLQPYAPLPESIPKDDDDCEEVCLRWNSHYSNMKTSFPSLLENQRFIDCTVTTEGQTIKCHRLILSSCSAYFEELLSGISPIQHPVIFLKGIPYWILKCLIDFMYMGEIFIEQSKLQDLLEVAECLQIKGLTGKAPKEPEVKHEIKKPEETKSSPATKLLPVKPAIITKLQAAGNSDPQSLLKPAFYEVGPSELPPKLKEAVPPKRTPAKKMRKRRSSEHAHSPPPLIIRKGTRSRPNVKMPKHYHNDYEAFNVKKPQTLVAPSPEGDMVIKMEPIDIDDSMIEDGCENFTNIQISVHDPVLNPLQVATTSGIKETPSNNGLEDMKLEIISAPPELTPKPPDEKKVKESIREMPKLRILNISTSTDNASKHNRLKVVDPAKMQENPAGDNKDAG